MKSSDAALTTLRTVAYPAASIAFKSGSVCGRQTHCNSLIRLCSVRVFFECFDVATRRAFVGDQFGQTTDPRHAADGRQPFTVASAVVGQFLKFG